MSVNELLTSTILSHSPVILSAHMSFRAQPRNLSHPDDMPRPSYPDPSASLRVTARALRVAGWRQGDSEGTQGWRYGRTG